MRRALLLLALAALVAAPLGPRLAAQRPSTGATGVITGTAFDSLAGAPLEGATIQLVAGDEGRRVERSALTGPGGRFRIDGIPAGRYLLGFLHPAVDGLGIEPPVRAVALEAGDSLRVDLAVPSADGVRRAACGSGAAARRAPAALIGIVRDAAGHAPVAGAVVQSTWVEYDLANRTIARRRAGVSDTTGRDGLFALCDVPRGGSLVLRASRDGDTTSILELQVPSTGLLRRDLYLGRARATVADSVRLLVGEGALHGRVTTAATRRPLGGVVVGIEGGPTTRTDANGAWSLGGLPAGTRMLEARRVGYYPARVAVDVVEGAPAVELALAEFQAVLDTVRVTASRWRLEDTGFEQRRRSGAGRYITAADMLRFPVIFTSDVFERIPGVRVERAALGETRLTVRGAFGRCAPDVYIDGLWMRTLSADDINAFVSPDEVAGIEVYGGAFVPAEFQQGMSGCGSVVIWTKPGENPARRWSWRRRALHGVAAVLLGAGIGVLFAHH